MSITLFREQTKLSNIVNGPCLPFYAISYACSILDVLFLFTRLSQKAALWCVILFIQSLIQSKMVARCSTHGFRSIGRIVKQYGAQEFLDELLERHTAVPPHFFLPARKPRK